MARASRPALRRRTSAYVVAALAALLLLLVPSPAGAHSELESTNPANGAVLKKAPDVATFRFNEQVAAVPGSVQVYDEMGRQVDAPVTTRDTVLRVDLPDHLGNGTWTIVWRVISADGHPIAGSLSFSVHLPSATVAAPKVPEESGRSVSVLLALTQVQLYLGLFVAAGLAVFCAWIALARPLPRRRLLRRTTIGAALLSLAGAVLNVAVTVVDQRAEGLDQLANGAVWQGAEPGVYPALVAVAIGLALAVATVVGIERIAAQVARPMAVAAVLVPAFGLSLTGHSRAYQPEPLVMTVDVLHVFAGSVWVGGVIGLVMLLPRSSAADAARTLSRFSTAAAATVALLVVTGGFLAWRVIGAWENLLDTAYGRLFLAKVDFVLIALAFAAVNRQLVRSGETGSVRREIRIEALLLVAVLAVTGVMVNQSPTTKLDRSGQRTTATARLGTDHKAKVELTPGQVGPTEVRVTVEDASGKAVAVKRRPTLSLRTARTDLGKVPLTRDGADAWIAHVVLPTAGAWTAQVSVRLSEFDNPVARVPVTVEPVG